MKRTISLVLLLAAPALAQREDTVYEQIFDGLATGGQASAPVRNIGQSQHTVYISLDDASGQTCPNSALFIAWFEGSSDGVAYQQIGSRTTSIVVDPAGVQATSISATSAQPYLRFYVAFMATQCTADVFYSGTLYPSDPRYAPFGTTVASGAWGATGATLSPMSTVGLVHQDQYYAELGLIFSDNGSSCTGLEALVRVEYSFDQTTWFELSEQTIWVSSQSGDYVIGERRSTSFPVNYPYLRANRVHAAGSNCSFSLFWNFSRLPFDSYENPQIYWTSFTASTNGSATLLPAKGSGKAAIYGFTLESECNASFELEAATTTSNDYFEAPNITGGFVQTVMGNLIDPLFVAPPGEAIRMQSTNGSEGGCSYSMAIAYTYK